MTSAKRSEVITEGTDPRVLACPGHVWREEDRRPPGVKPSATDIDWWICDICQMCRAIRCDAVLNHDHGQRCLEARHHIDQPHRYPNGALVEIGR